MMSAELEVVLPGAAEIDNELLARAVQDINAIHGGKAREAAIAVAQYIVKTFFCGEVKNFYQRGWKHASYKALANSHAMNMSYSALDKCVRVLRQMTDMPKELGEALPYTHHQLLLPVKDPVQKTKLAQEVIDHDMPKRELEMKIKKL